MATKKTTDKAKKAVAKKEKTPVKKAAAKKTVSAKNAKETAKKATAKKVATQKTVAKKTVVATKKPAAKKVAVKSHVAKKTAPKKIAAAKPVVKKVKVAPKKVESKKTTTVKASTAVKPVPPKKKEKVKEQKNTGKIAKKIKKEAGPIKEVKVPKISTTTKKSYSPSYIPMNERPVDINQEPLVRYSEEELQEFKTLIQKKLADAKREVSYLQGIITRRDEMGGDIESRYMTMEDGTISMEREQQSQMVSRQISYIDNLEKALIRIENKTYGICRITGKLIDKARLRAVPHATLSIEAKLNRKNTNEQ